MRLTLELLQQAHQSLNPASQRQILLRGFKIPTIENLGGTNDAYECIDLSDNDLIKLNNFPPLKRLKVLLLTNNRISRIAEDCFDPLPNLVSIALTGNKLERLADLEPLTRLKTLERLSLLENPVTKVKHYRPYMINKCSKTLRILDFNRIKDKERKAAGLLFAGERGRKLLEEIAPPRTGKEVSAEKAGAAPAVRTGPTPEVIERIKKAIADAETIEEVTRLERALKSGILPDDLKGPEPAPQQPPAFVAPIVEAPTQVQAPPVGKVEAPKAMDVDDGKNADTKSTETEKKPAEASAVDAAKQGAKLADNKVEAMQVDVSDEELE